MLFILSLLFVACSKDKSYLSNIEAPTTSTIETPVELNMLFNPAFSSKLSVNIPDDQGNVDTEKNWIFFTNSGATATYETSSDGIKVTPIDIAGKPNYGIQLIQSPIALESNGIYKISITAKSDASRKINLKIGATGDKGWIAYFTKDVFLTTQFEQYDLEFTMSGEADLKARFELSFADASAPVEIQNVTMTKSGIAEATITMDDLTSRTKTEEDENAVEQWELIWSDEFDGALLDASKWTPEIGNGADKGNPGWGNGELEYYTDSPSNLSVQDGKLVISAQKEQKTFTANGIDYTTDYTSSRIITQNKFSTTYGKIEARIKVPSGQGIWPAFWLLGQDIGDIGWPGCGEIDILEYIGSNTSVVHGTVHGPVTSGPGIHHQIDTGVDMSLDFHTYSIEWDADEVEFYFDDILYHIVSKDEVALEHGAKDWVYDHDYFIILNLAVGGTWPGSPNSETVFPSQLEVDYVRVYKDINPDSIDGQEIIDSDYEKPLPSKGIESFSNGDFSDGVSPWDLYVHFDASALIHTVNDEAVIEISNDGNEDYSVLFEQGKFLLDKNKTYRLEFDAKATIERPMITVIDNDKYTRPFSQNDLLSTDMKHYTYEFTGISDEVTLKFLLGEQGANISAPYKVFIDNVTLKAID